MHLIFIWALCDFSLYILSTPHIIIIFIFTMYFIIYSDEVKF
jgi:hypothetical protein